jgi:hypothetical protein
MGYKCLHVATGRVYIARHVIFNKQVFPFKGMVTSASTLALAPLALPGNLRIPTTTASCTGFVTAELP